jgi:hypothetical protein
VFSSGSLLYALLRTAGIHRSLDVRRTIQAASFG